MSKTPKSSSEVAEIAAEEAGQLYTDILRYMKSGNSGVQWFFTPDVIADGVNKADMEDLILDHIEKLVEKHSESLAKDRGFSLKTQSERDLWKQQKEAFYDAISADETKLVSIYEFENIIKQVN